VERRLAAILAADVVGYSGLMEQDEAGTFARMRQRRADLVEPAIARHHGRIFKLMGDGLLAEFGSAVDAVECAAAIQHAIGCGGPQLPLFAPVRRCPGGTLSIAAGIHVARAGGSARRAPTALAFRPRRVRQV
jgi:class 3 adenylate cyclase